MDTLKKNNILKQLDMHISDGHYAPIARKGYGYKSTKEKKGKKKELQLEINERKKHNFLSDNLGKTRNELKTDPIKSLENFIPNNETNPLNTNNTRNADKSIIDERNFSDISLIKQEK
jgi:hypothetical protein